MGKTATSTPVNGNGHHGRSKRSKGGTKPQHTDLSRLLEESVYPSLYDQLEIAFPEFAFVQKGGQKEATSWPVDFPMEVEDRRPGRITCYADAAHMLWVHGHHHVRWLDYLNRGRKPRGEDFIASVRRLCELSGVPFPDRKLTKEEREQSRAWEERRAILVVVLACCREKLQSEGGAKAREYLESRGFTSDDLRELGFGLYPDAAEIVAFLESNGCDPGSAAKHCVLTPKLSGFVVLPWNDPAGSPMTLYGRWAANEPPLQRDHEGWRNAREKAIEQWPGPPDKFNEPKVPKTFALPGDGTKASPLFFDRALRAGHRDTIIGVEGLFDAALLQCRGETRAVAYVGAQFDKGQIETLSRYRVRRVVIVPDPDGGGDRGALSSIGSLRARGIESYVARRLPDGLDPDEFLRREGLDGWMRHIADPTPGAIHECAALLGGIAPESPLIERREAVSRLAEFVRGIRDDVDRRAVLKLIRERTGFTLQDVREMLKQAAPPGPGAARNNARTEDDCRYLEDAGSLFHVATKRVDGKTIEICERIAWFTGRIVEDIVRHECGDERRQYRIRVTRDGGKHAKVAVIDAGEFEAMNWIHEHIGPEWLIEPGKGVKDLVRAAIQYFSTKDGIAKKEVYTSLGWIERDGRPCYLHGGGAIGEGGPTNVVHVEVLPALARYRLPDPPKSPEATRACVDACLAILDLAKANRPGASGVAVMIATLPWRSVLGPIDGTAHFSGGTGTRKTSVSLLGLSHFAAGVARGDRAPVAWNSTAGSLQRWAYDCNCSLLVIDELTGEKAVALATEFIQNQGNLKGRDRMDKDYRLSPSLDPRCGVLSTGEADPTRQSSLGRMLTARFARDTIDLATLSACQENAASGKYAGAMAAYIRWLAAGDRLSAVLTEHRDVVERIAEGLRKKVTDGNVHPRHINFAAELAAAYRPFLRFAVGVDALSCYSEAAYSQTIEQYLVELVSDQGETQHESHPGRRFLALLTAGLASKRFHLIDANSDHAPSVFAGACGWHMKWLYQGNDIGQGLDWDIPPNSRHVGFIDEKAGQIYIDPENAKVVARAMGRDQGEEFENVNQIGRELADAKLIVTAVEGGKVRYTPQKRIRNFGKQRYYVIPIRHIFDHPGGEDGPESSDVVPTVPTGDFRVGTQ